MRFCILTAKQEDGTAAYADADKGEGQVTLHIISMPSQCVASVVVVDDCCICHACA